MQVVVCSKCGAKNRVEEDRLATSEAKCGRCGEKLEPGVAATGDQDSKPVSVTDQTFEREVLQAKGRPVLVDMWAPWCPPCRMIAPVLDELAAESQGRYRIAKLNVDDTRKRLGVLKFRAYLPCSSSETANSWIASSAHSRSKRLPSVSGSPRDLLRNC